MNCDNWLEPKNSLIAATIGFGLTNVLGVRELASQIVILSRTILSNLFNPTRTWFCSNSPTDLTLLLPK